MLTLLPTQFYLTTQSPVVSKGLVPLIARINPVEQEAFGAASQAKSLESNVLYNEFYQMLMSLPAFDSPDTLADEVYRLMNEFNSSENGERAFVSFEQQTGMLQNLLGNVDDDSDLSEALRIVLVGTMNAQLQMMTWMQDIILSGGEPEESIEW